MTQNWTKIITTKMKMTKNSKKVYKRYYQWLSICRKNIIILKLSMAYNIGIVNFAHTCKGQSYGVHPLWYSILVNAPKNVHLKKIVMDWWKIVMGHSLGVCHGCFSSHRLVYLTIQLYRNFECAFKWRPPMNTILTSTPKPYFR